MAELLSLHQALNALEPLVGDDKTALSALFGVAIGSTEGRSENGAAPGVRFDEFVGLESLQAAKKYLKKCADARPFAEIVEVIKRGGGKVDNEENLRTGLTRSTLDVVKIGDRFGAIEKYPDIKRGGKKKGAKTDAGEISAAASDDISADSEETSEASND